jgi:hypothetical protein
MERARTWIAFGIFVAVVVATGTYAFSKPAAGQAYVLAETLPIALIGLCINLFRQHRGKKARWDFVFLAMATAAVVANWNSMRSNYEAYRLQRELASVSTQTEAQQIIARSNSRLGREMDQVRQIAEETSAEVARAFASLDDPALTGALAPANLEDPEAIDSALKIATEKHDDADSVAASVQNIISGERKRVADALTKLGLSGAEIDPVLEGVDRRHAASQPLYLAQMQLARDLLAEICATLRLLSTERGRYQVRPDGFVNFDSDVAAKEYVDHITALRGIAFKEDEISAKLNGVAANYMILQWTKRAR